MGTSNHHNSYHLTTDNTITTWQDIIGDAKKNKTMAQILRDILKKVDKEDGKCLIPVEELARLHETATTPRLGVCPASVSSGLQGYGTVIAPFEGKGLCGSQADVLVEGTFGEIVL